MPNVLVISRHFPPLSSAGASIRLIKFIKYITPLGWEFIVFTQDPDQPVVPEAHLSGFLEDEIPKETVIVRVPAPAHPQRHSKISAKDDPGIEIWGNRLYALVTRLLPDTSLIWGLRVLRQAYRYMRECDVDIIFAIAPVFTNAFIGGLLAWSTKKTFYLDIKDDWVDSPRYWGKPRWRRIIEKSLERLLVKLSSGVTLVTESSYQRYVDRYEDLGQSEKFQYIPNGCDLEEYLGPMNIRDNQENSRFTLLSAAWGYQKDYRDITPFLEAVAHFINLYSAHRDQIRIVFLGDSLSGEYDDLITTLGLQDNIVKVGPVVREDLTNWLWQADLFFLVQPVGNTTAIAGTLYEYWATGKAPILLISDEGASSELIRNHNLGSSFRFDDIKGITHYICEIYEHYCRHEPVRISAGDVGLYDRKNLAQKMADLWQESLTPPTISKPGHSIRGNL